MLEFIKPMAYWVNAAFVVAHPLTLLAKDALAHEPTPSVMTVDILERLAQAHQTSLLIGACLACWLMGSVIGALYPVPKDSKITDLNIWLKLLICIAGGFFAFLWVLSKDGSINLLTPVWVGVISFVSPHLLQSLPSMVKDKLGMGGKK